MKDPAPRLALRIEGAFVRHVGGSCGVGAVDIRKEPTSAPAKVLVFIINNSTSLSHGRRGPKFTPAAIADGVDRRHVAIME
jgi:hypothetical protein